MIDNMHVFEKLHMLIRCWRYRFKSEVHSIKYVRSLNSKDMTILDIGANRGIYSLYMSHVAGKKGKVIAFEAQPELEESLFKLKKSFNLDNLEIINLALSSSVGSMTLQRKFIGSGAASFNFYDQNDQDLDSIDIAVTTLDDFLESRNDNPINFIKCDVEGHEADVFYGAKQTLMRDMPTLLFECHQSEEQKGELFSFLTEIGYTGFFYHVEPKDHANIFKRGKGKYIHFTKHSEYDYCRPSVQHRNYVFFKDGEETQNKIFF